MGEKVYTLVIKVDLSCDPCKKGIHDHLCSIQHKEHIVEIKYDEKNNVVRVSGPFDAEQLKKKLLCNRKLRKIIKSIEIEHLKKEEKPKPKDERKEKFLKQCEEEYAELTKSIEKCKKECEDKCIKEWEDKFQGKSKDKCKCKCNCKSKCSCECNCKKEEPKKEPEKPKDEPKKEPKKPKEEPKKEPEKPKPPVLQLPWPSQFTTICCAKPCLCFEPLSNNFQCCTCGVVSWPGWLGPAWGTGPSHGGHPQWACEPSRPQRLCEPPNIILESSPNCSIM